MKRTTAIVILIIIISIAIVSSVVTSLLSWSEVPEPAKSINYGCMYVVAIGTMLITILVIISSSRRGD